MAPMLHVVTGAFSYTGKYIARRLLAAGHRVKTLTGHPGRDDPFGGRIAAMPYDFDRPDALAGSLEGVDTLYNTYWVRFARGDVTHERAVENTRTLFRAAGDAGVRRIVHISITSASSSSPLPYFHGKGVVEEALMSSRVSHAVLRPTIIFGREDILINNIAWALRRFPIFPMFGPGDYPVQPIYVEDLADIAVDAGARSEDMAVDAVGPDTLTFEGLVRLIAETIGRRARVLHLPPGLALWLSRIVGLAVGDVALTQDEVDGLMAGLLVSDKPPLGTTRLADWLAGNAALLGTRYASEVERHYR